MQENLSASYPLAFGSLSQLEHLKLVMFFSQVQENGDILSRWHRKRSSDLVPTLLGCHNTLKSLQLCTYGAEYHVDVYFSRFCFTREDQNLKEVPAKNLESDFDDVFEQLMDDFDAL